MNTQKQEKSDRDDLTVALTVGLLVVAFIVYDAVTRLAQLFGVEGALTAPVPMPSADTAVGTDLDAAASADTVMLSVEGVNAVSAVSFVLSIALPALAYAAALALGLRLCQHLLRGRFFDPANARFAVAASLLMLGGALVGVFFQTLGLNGMLAAAGGEFTEHTRLLLQAAPTFLAAIAVGVLPIIFRRGLDLQKETEGLV